MTIIGKIEELTRPIIESRNAFLIDVEVQNGNNGRRVEIFIDNDHGVTTELCAELSREISRVIDQTELFKSRYHLIVSSPGIERPLKFQRQYPKHVGRKMNLQIQRNGQSEILRGTLVEVTDEALLLETGEETIRKVLFSSVLRACAEAAW